MEYHYGETEVPLQNLLVDDVGAIAKAMPIEVTSQANHPLVRTSASGYWISRAEIRKLVDPCCTPWDHGYPSRPVPGLD
jgi:hypothetical protein